MTGVPYCRRCRLMQVCINGSIAFALLMLLYLTVTFSQSAYDARVHRASLDEVGSSSERDLVPDPAAREHVGETGGDDVVHAYDVHKQDKADTDDITGDDPVGSNDGVGVDTERTQLRDDSKDEAVVSSRQDDRPPFIIVLAQWRFGSSIIGEIFNQNPNVLFLFEPLWLVDALRRSGKLPKDSLSKGVHDYSTDVLRGLAGCNFTREFVQVTDTWDGGLRNNRAICKATSMSCKLRNPKSVRSLCLKFKGNIATKIIRADLDNIRPLIVDDKVNVKVIHLVRDPRGAAASRIHYYFEFSKDLVNQHKTEFAAFGRLAPIGLNNFTARPKDCIPQMCTWMRENIRNSSTLPDWLRNRYYLLKYEDFAEAPVKTTKDLYQFAGLPLPVSVTDWVVKHTQVQRSDTGTFQVKKNSKVTAKRWLSDLSELEISQVEADCMKVMNMLGYEPYADLKL